jgi:hypothetical protein
MPNWRDASTLSPGPVSLAQALGLPPAQNDTLQARLPAQVDAELQAKADENKATGGNTGSGNTQPTGGSVSGNRAANKRLGQQLAASYGWSTGSQWTALNNLVMGESGWDNNAQNPTSTAYGIGQFLNTTWATVGGTKTSNPTIQIKLMLKYIKMRYGTPEKAWAMWQARSPHWY